jgi:retron-type reverse transcriptase
MKRIGMLYDGIWHWDTLRVAFHLARKGSRHSRDVVSFEKNLDRNLRHLQGEIRSERVCLAGFTQFVIHDPKERTITAPGFRDRVLHHAIMQVCEPFFDRWLISDSYACRKGKGRLAALQRATGFARQHGWFLKLDIRKYFESIPQERLLVALARKFKDHRLLGLFEQILRSHPKGLPIGSLTSQHWANFYLGSVDRLVKEHLRIPGYVRYMDDFVLWDNDPNRLKHAWSVIEHHVVTQLGLELKAGSNLNRCSHGMDFCGFRVFPGWRILNRRSLRRFSASLKSLQHVEDERIQQTRGQALIAFASEGHTWHQRKRALARATTA